VLPPRAAAVVIAIFADPPHNIAFVERAAHLRNHPGQIGLPGGAADPADDGDLARTALRELEEELGVYETRIHLVDQLPTIVQRVSNFAVTPFVGIVEPKTPLVIDPSETAAVFTVPLATVVAPGAVHEGIEVIGERAIDTWIFDYGDRHVWGLTGAILRSFTVSWNDPATGLRSAIDGLLR